MTENERIIRKLYDVAEAQDSRAFTELFTPDGYFWDVSAGQRYFGADIGKTVDIYAKAFPDMHRALEVIYVTGDVVIVELSLNGTHKGPLALPAGTIPATGKEIHAPCCDVFHLENGKVKSFHCYTAATILMGQLGVMGNLQAALAG
ncbi:nuclear transport factor 2 family protein [Bradyrhizobium sp. WYCCWR 13022]|uniref:nuclear transport factor 2 family protein n=1 Tax=unclassified Bradyrhizobium TaxID=2631580 RepID=UPI00263AFED4|nr:nuclear transport factor 2 family protein [Bradyrhizobium sp. WYCCWR 13022]MDN4984299.1 nuclear transport factor 2 family protein [Bradyrhizobium sp. WYCCWR 13022]